MINYENLVIGTLANDAFVMVNKKLAREIGFVEAGLLSEIISTYRYVKENYDFYKGGEKGPWFYLTQDTIKERLGMTREIQDTAIRKLVKTEVIEKKRLGLPAKNHFLINWEKIVEILSKNNPEPAPQSDCGKPTNKKVGNPQTGSRETHKQESGKSTYFHTNKKDIQEKNIKTNIKDIDDDDHAHEEKFEINNFAFNEFKKEFEAMSPNYFDSDMYNRIYDQMIKQKVSIITFAEAYKQALYMLEKTGKGETISDYATYFVGGIKRNRKSLKSALADEETRKAVKYVSEKMKEQIQQEKANGTYKEPLPFYNWLDEH